MTYNQDESPEKRLNRQYYDFDSVDVQYSWPCFGKSRFSMPPDGSALRNPSVTGIESLSLESNILLLSSLLDIILSSRDGVTPMVVNQRAV